MICEFEETQLIESVISVLSIRAVYADKTVTDCVLKVKSSMKIYFTRFLGELSSI